MEKDLSTLTKNNNGKKIGRNILKIIITALVLIIVMILLSYIFNIKLIKTSYGNIVKSGVTAESIKEKYEYTKIDLCEGNDTYTYTYIDLGIKPVFSNEQLDYIRKNIILDENIIKPTYNTDEMLSIIEKLNKDRQDYKYAELKETNSKFIVTDEIKSNLIDTCKIKDYIVSLLDGTYKKIDLTEYYIERNDDKPTYEELVSEVRKINNTYIEYTNGYRISLSDYAKYCLIENNSIIFNQNLLNEFKTALSKQVNTELDYYNTVGKPMLFTNSYDETIEIGGGTWGDIVNKQNETEYIFNKLVNFENEDERIPILSQDYSDEINGTYIEVSIENQHVWYYKDYKLIIDSGCVTGNKGSMDTPTGVYYIFQKAHNVHFPTGGSSRNWMKFTERGHGLHDATWRSKNQFGTDRYTWNGSHGCVNLPLDFANELYDNVEIGTCVVIY